jgi:tetratricopeptide (TPR) repeat protein
LKEAEQLFREILPIRQRVQGADHPDTLHCIENLAGVLSAEGRLNESEQMYRESLKASVRILGAEYPETLAEQFNIAVLLNKEGRAQEAEKLDAATLAAQMRILGPENPDTLSSQSLLVEIMLAQHRYAEAERKARQVYAIQLRNQGPQHPETMYSLQLLGTSLALDRRYPEAVHLFDSLLKTPGEAGDPENRWRAWYSLACVATAADRAGDAIGYLREAVNRGYTDADGLMADKDLKNLHPNPHFQEIVATLRSTPKAAQAQ